MRIFSRDCSVSSQLPPYTYRPASPPLRGTSLAANAFALMAFTVSLLSPANTVAQMVPSPATQATATNVVPAPGPKPDASPAEKAAYTAAFEKCEIELSEDYARKIAKAIADGKPQFVAVYERRRGEALAGTLCPDTADIAAADQRIAAADQSIAANRADIAANRADIAAYEALNRHYDNAKRVADKITANTATRQDVADLERTYQSLKDINAANPNPGIQEVLPLIEGVLNRARRLNTMR